jgi:ATP-dependent DNA ligase
MTDLLPDLASFPTFGTFDGELVALDSSGAPDFPLVRADADAPPAHPCRLRGL